MGDRRHLLHLVRDEGAGVDLGHEATSRKRLRRSSQSGGSKRSRRDEGDTGFRIDLT